MLCIAEWIDTIDRTVHIIDGVLALLGHCFITTIGQIDGAIVYPNISCKLVKCNWWIKELCDSWAISNYFSSFCKIEVCPITAGLCKQLKKSMTSVFNVTFWDVTCDSVKEKRQANAFKGGNICLSIDLLIKGQSARQRSVQHELTYWSHCKSQQHISDQPLRAIKEQIIELKIVILQV